MATAAAKVLVLPELIEKILLELTVADIFVAQAVSKSFQNTIQSSPLLQKKLFVDSDPKRSAAHPELNPLYDNILKIFGLQNGRAQVIRGQLTTFGHGDHVSTQSDQSFQVYLSFHEGCKAPSGRKTGSWKNMLAVDPPCKLVVQLPCGHHVNANEEDSLKVTMEELMNDVFMCDVCTVIHEPEEDGEWEEAVSD